MHYSKGKKLVLLSSVFNKSVSFEKRHILLLEKKINKNSLTHISGKYEAINY